MEHTAAIECIQVTSQPISAGLSRPFRSRLLSTNLIAPLLGLQAGLWIVCFLAGRTSEIAVVLPLAGVVLSLAGIIEGMRTARNGYRWRGLNCVMACSATLFFWKLQMIIGHIALF